jgi:voltage-gated potassium channel
MEYQNPDFSYSWYRALLKYVFQPLNIIDLVAIIPFYVTYIVDGGSSLSIIRILRLARIIRLIKGGKGKFTKGLKILQNTLVQSAPMNFFLLCIAIIMFIICGAIEYLLEGGEFKVTADYPKGAYYRQNLLNTHQEPTPFESVLHGLYWSIVTSTTVGYGDFYPTSPGGRIFACACTFLGIIAIAMPVTVLGTHFNKEYEKEYLMEALEKEESYIESKSQGSFVDISPRLDSLQSIKVAEARRRLSVIFIFE